MKLGLVIVNFHSVKDTLEIVSDIEKCQVPGNTDLNIYVVDNSQSAELKKSLQKYDHAIYIPSDQNVGFAAGNNLGLKRCIGDNIDIIALINNDTSVKIDFLEKILSSSITDSQVGLVGGLIYFAKGFEFEKNYKENEKGKVVWYAGGEIDWDNVYTNHIGVNIVDNGQFNKSKETDFVTGCLFITKKEVLKKVGLLDENYCLYYEDSDLGMRIKNVGFKIVFDPNIKLWHKVAQGSAIGSPLNDYFITRNRLLFGFTYARMRTRIALFRESIRKLFTGTKAQKRAIKDFYTGNLGWGSWKKTT